jgi:ADP-heptose:LPS heptosyltransferase
MNRWAGIARFGGVGDNLMAASPFRALKRMGYMTEMITSEPNHVVYFNNPHIDKLSVKNTERDLPQNDLYAWQKWFDSRAREFDIFLHASHACEGRHAFFKTMTTFWWAPEARRKIAAGSYLETVHDIGCVPYEFGPLFFPTVEEYGNALITKKQVGERFILWVLSGTRIDKVYPYAPMAIARIIKEIGAPVVLMGGPSEKEYSMASAIKEYVETTNGNKNGLHLAIPSAGGEKCWPLRVSLAFAMVADLVVTPDTGPAWAVAFENMPKILMLSHASPENVTKHWVNTVTLHADQNSVPCWPCHRLHDDPSTCVQNKEGNGAKCISDITVEKLVQTVREQWNKDGNIIHAEQVFAMARNPAGWQIPGSERLQ